MRAVSLGRLQLPIRGVGSAAQVARLGMLIADHRRIGHNCD